VLGKHYTEPQEVFLHSYSVKVHDVLDHMMRVLHLLELPAPMSSLDIWPSYKRHQLLPQERRKNKQHCIFVQVMYLELSMLTECTS
jgi:hypothetical protein